MKQHRRIIVVGATGLIGKEVSQRLLQEGYALVVFSRRPEEARRLLPGAQEYVSWQPQEQGDWSAAVDGAYGVINLAGAPFFTRWTGDYYRTVVESRLIGTRGLIKAIRDARVKPAVFIGGGSVGYYGFDGKNQDLELAEDAPAGSDFWGRDTLEFEQEILTAQNAGARAVIMRTGVVLAPPDQQNALTQQVAQMRRFMGGWVQPGTQWMPWIHLADEAGLILFALEHESVQGPLNASAPFPVRNRDFARILGKVLHRPVWLPFPASMLKRFVGEAAESVIHSKRVIPKKALKLGYRFQFPECEQAVRDLLQAT